MARTFFRCVYFAAVLLTAIAPASVAEAQNTYTPPPGSAERASIMDAIRTGTGSTSIFIVEHLRVTRGHLPEVAFVEVRAQEGARRPFDGAAMLAYDVRSDRWEFLFAITLAGRTPCTQLSNVGDIAFRAAGPHGNTLFSDRFRRSMTEAGAAGNVSSLCHGTLVVPDERNDAS